MFSNNSQLVKKVMHIKGRRTCNQPCGFSDCNKLELHVVGDKSLDRDFRIRPHSDEIIQCSPVYALSTCNTDNFLFTAKGITHVEGGWPKDVNSGDAEQVARYRKKIERDDVYARQVGELCRKLERVILQNTAVNIYESYFRDADGTSADNGNTGGGAASEALLLPVAEKCFAKTTNTYKDFTGEKVGRGLE